MLFGRAIRFFLLFLALSLVDFEKLRPLVLGVVIRVHGVKLIGQIVVTDPAEEFDGFLALDFRLGWGQGLHSSSIR